jgi:hypothetical protein
MEMHGDMAQGSGGGCGLASPQTERLIDAWLRPGLAARYDVVLSERLPADWLDLIRGPG